MDEHFEPSAKLGQNELVGVFSEARMGNFAGWIDVNYVIFDFVIGF